MHIFSDTGHVCFVAVMHDCIVLMLHEGATAIVDACTTALLYICASFLRLDLHVLQYQAIVCACMMVAIHTCI